MSSLLSFPRKPQLQEVSEIRAVALPAFRIFLNFIDNIVSAVQSEIELERARRTKFVYLLDFDIIHDYISPNMRVREQGKSTLSNYVATAEFFSNIQEDFSIPLGTFLEISNFLQRQVSGIPHLHAASLASSLDSAVGSLNAYFGSDSFLTVGQPIDSLGPSEEVRLINAQIEAVRLLSDSEVGIRRLYSLLTHPKLLNVFDLIARHPFVIPEASFNNVKRQLDAFRGSSRQRPNQADAYNVSFADQLNVHFQRRFDAGKLDRPYFFRLLTNTNTLYRLTDHQMRLAIRFQFQQADGHTLDLLEGTEEATAKRIFRQVTADHGFSEVRAFADRRNRAELALGRLVDMAAENELSIEQLLQRLHEPQEPKDRALALQLLPSVTDLQTFFRPSPAVVKALIDRSIRRDLFPSDNDGDRRYLLPYGAAADLSALEALLGSVQNAISDMDTLGFNLTPLQANDPSKSWSNPVMSLRNLGYETKTQEFSHLLRWQLLDQSSRLVLCVDRLRDHWSIYWPTEVAGYKAFLEGYSAFLEMAGKSDVLSALRVINFDGRQLIRRCQLGEMRLEESDLLDAAFFRLDLNDDSFVCELFAGTDSPQHGVTGVLIQDFNLHLILQLMSVLGRERRDFLFRRLMAKELRGVFERLEAGNLNAD
jgi:hypothetical protein